MNAQIYCETVEEQSRELKKQIQKIPIKDDGTKLVSLAKTELNLVFELSIKKNYQYLVREAVFNKVINISKILEKEDKLLIIRSVWRSFDHQRLLFENKVSFLKTLHTDLSIEEIKERVTCFIAPPTESMHSTGGAVDALIYDKKAGCVMDFGTNDGLIIDLSDECYPLHPFISPLAKKNRALLIKLFKNEDFVCDLKEYWHFDYGNVNWAYRKNKTYAIYDIIKEK